MADDGAPKRQWQFGAHTMWEAAPDVIQLELVGIIDGPELKSIIETQRAWAEGKSSCFSLTDMSRIKGSTPSARTYISRRPQSLHSVSISFGASFSIRILLDMARRARRMIKPEAPDNWILVATEADAWVEIEKRRKLRGATS